MGLCTSSSVYLLNLQCVFIELSLNVHHMPNWKNVLQIHQSYFLEVPSLLSRSMPVGVGTN